MPPFGYFITFTTYGTWLHGRTDGSVNKQQNIPGHPFLEGDNDILHQSNSRLRQRPYELDHARREVALRTIQEVSQHRKWNLWAAHVRTQHIHIVVSSPELPEKVMRDYKAWISRRLREKFQESADRDRWTQHGSTRWLNNEESLENCVVYVVDQQGDAMSVFDYRKTN